MKFLKLCEVAGGTEAELLEVINVFRKPSRSFLMPERAQEINADTVMDISHESLMRVWNRLKDWTDEEAEARREYRRLLDRANGYRQHRFGLMQDPDLQTALDFEKQQEPTAAWAELYGGGLDQVSRYLRQSEQKRDEEKAERELDRRWGLRWQPVLFGIAALSFVLTLLAYRGSLLPPSGDLTQAALAQATFRQSWVLLASFCKITFLALPFALAYSLAARYGKGIYYRMARPFVMSAVRNPVNVPGANTKKAAEPIAAMAAVRYAPWWRRTIALVIDFSVLSIGFFVIVIVAAIFAGPHPSDLRMSAIAYPLYLPWLFGYHALTVGSRRQATLGVRAARLHAANLHGLGLSPWAAVQREFIKVLLLPVWFYWPLVYLAAKFLFPKRPFIKRKQWLSDIVSRSVVLTQPNKSRVAEYRSPATIP